MRGYSIWTVLVILGSTPKNYHTMLLLHCLRSFWLFSRFSRLRGSEVSPFRVFAMVSSLFAAPCVVFDLPERCCGGAAVPPALASSRVYQQRAETQPKEIVTSAGRVLTPRPSTSIDQLTNISNDPGSRSVIRSRSDPLCEVAGNCGIIQTDAGELSVLARIDSTCWVGAQGGLHIAVAPGNVTR